MRKYLLGIAAGAVSLAATLAASYEVPEEEPVARLNFPDDWRTKHHDEFIEATSADGEAHVLVTKAEGRKVNESIGEVMRYIRGRSGIIFNSESMEQKPLTINGVELKTVSWTGKDMKGDLKITFAIMPMSGEEPLLVASWAHRETETKHQPAVRKILESVKRI